MFNSIEPYSRATTARRVATFLVSTAAHFLALVILVMLPLIFIGAVPEIDLISFLIAAPEPPPAASPPTPPIEPQARPVSKSLDDREFKIPQGIPDRISPPDFEPVSEGQYAGIITGIPGGLGIGSPVGVPGGTLGILGAETPVLAPPPPKPALKKDPVRRVSEMQASKLIRRVEPVYPPLAIVSRVSGIVVLEVRVDEDGNVETIRVLSGHPLLRDSSVDAVRQWKYSPTVLNGEPVPVIATVTVIFNLR